MASRQLTGRTVALTGSAAAGAMLFGAWWFGLREPPPSLPDPADTGRFSFPQIVPPGDGVRDDSGTKSLTVGDRFPSLDAPGWLNGPPIPAAASESGITVVDVWNEECPVCHEAAPGLLAIHEKYAARGVNFVGLTARSHDDAEAFVEQHNIGWPNGYGIKNLQEAAPQVFIIDRDSRILWHDGRLRYLHQADRLIQELDAAAESALAGAGG